MNSLLSPFPFSPSPNPLVPHLNPIMCLVDSERRGLKLPTGHPFSQPSPRPPGQTGACLLSLGHKIQSGSTSAGLSDLLAGKREEKQRPLISDRPHRCGFRGLPHLLEEVLPYFQDKVLFMRAMCWTNQVNWEAPSSSHWAHLSFLLEADSADRQINRILVAPRPLRSPWNPQACGECRFSRMSFKLCEHGFFLNSTALNRTKQNENKKQALLKIERNPWNVWFLLLPVLLF